MLIRKIGFHYARTSFIHLCVLFASFSKADISPLCECVAPVLETRLLTSTHTMAWAKTATRM